MSARGAAGWGSAFGRAGIYKKIVRSFKVHPTLNAVPELPQFMESLAERSRAAPLPADSSDCVHNRCARTRVERQDVAAPQFELQQ